MQHRHEQALSLAERSVELQEQAGTPHGLGVALASLGQICVRVGNLKRAEEALNRALDVRSPLHFMRETTGAVFDTLAQIHLIRGEHEQASRCLQKAREGYGETFSSRWYQWSVRALEARVALRRGDAEHRACRLRRDRGVGRCPGLYAPAGRTDCDRSAPRARPRRRCAAAARRCLRAGAAGGDERDLGRIPAAARPSACRRRARDRGVPRLRPERQRVRSARRRLSGRAQLPRAWPARGRRPARARGRRGT